MRKLRKGATLVQEYTRFVLFVSIGTLARATDRYFQRFLNYFGVNLEAGTHVRIVHFDAQEDAAAAQIPSSSREDGPLDNRCLTFVEGQTPDEESLQKLEQKGTFHFHQPDWATKAGQAKEDAGTGGNARTGRALFEAARLQVDKAIDDTVREFLAYSRQQAKVIGSKADPDGAVLQVVLTYSTPGGVGPGVKHEMVRLIERRARHLGAHVKVMSMGMGLGSIPPINPAQGIRNEVAFLHYAQADQVADLDYVGNDGSPSHPASESAVLLTNQNEFGEISTLQQFLGMVGYFKFQIACTAPGRLLTERIVDIEKNREFDDHGGPCWISTMGLSIISVDVDRVLAFAGYELMDALCTRTLTPPDSRVVRKEVLATARDLKILEQPDEPLASACVAQSELLGAAGLHDRLAGVFHARPDARFGFRLCRQLPSALRHCITRELSQNLIPALQEESRSLLKKAVKRIKDEVSQWLKLPDALKRAQASLASWRAAVKQFSDSNAETTRAAIESLKPLEQTLSDTEDEIERLAQESWLLRLLKPFTMARINRTYMLTGVAALRCHAEIELRNVLAQEVYRPLEATIAEEETRINSVVARVEALVERAKSKKEEIASVPADRLAPVGYEIVNREFLMHRIAQMFERMGGPRKITDGVFHSFLEQFGSIEGLLAGDLDETEGLLTPILEVPFEEAVRAMDVLTVFREEHPEPAKQKQIIEQQVRQAAGRLMVTGEAGKRVPWIKIAGVGSVEGASWFLKLLREADHVPSEWMPSEHGDPYSVSLLMYRTGISLDSLLQQIRRRHGVDHRSLTPDSGPDPITHVLPSVRPDRNELARTMVRALAIGAIREQAGLFAVVDSTTGDVAKGHEPGEFRRTLAKVYPARVDLTIRFVKGLISDRPGILEQLRLLREKAKNANTGIAKLIDGQAVTDVEKEADDLWLFLKRVPDGRT